MKYYLKRNYFGTGGKVYVPYWKYILYKIFTDYALYKEEEE